jgi:aspartate racemase
MRKTEKTNIRIGVLGGIGPEATGEFYTKLITAMQSRGMIASNKDFPQIFINSIPAPELIGELVSEEELQPYKRGLAELDICCVDFIVMVCNTIHLYRDELEKELTTPILDLRSEMRKRLGNAKSIVVLGTPTTLKKGLYSFDSIDCIQPKNNELTELSNAVYLFNKGESKDEQRQKVEVIAQKYVRQGAEKVVLGCTEFAVMLDTTKLPTLNAIDVLVDAVIEKVMAMK